MDVSFIAINITTIGITYRETFKSAKCFKWKMELLDWIKLPEIQKIIVILCFFEDGSFCQWDIYQLTNFKWVPNYCLKRGLKNLSFTLSAICALPIDSCHWDVGKFICNFIFILDFILAISPILTLAQHPAHPHVDF